MAEGVGNDLWLTVAEHGGEGIGGAKVDAKNHRYGELAESAECYRELPSCFRCAGPKP